MAAAAPAAGGVVEEAVAVEVSALTAAVSALTAAVSALKAEGSMGEEAGNAPSDGRVGSLFTAGVVGY